MHVHIIVRSFQVPGTIPMSRIALSEHPPGPPPIISANPSRRRVMKLKRFPSLQ